MKKFSISFFILLLFSALVFFIGWTQFKVKAGQIGVVISKTSGIDEVPVENGVFSWHWQFLLPTNASLKTISIEPVNTTKIISGELASGALYSQIFNSQDDFSYHFKFSLSVNVAPSDVVNLLKMNKITGTEDLHDYLEQASSSIAQLAADYYLKRASENPDFRPESVRREDLLRNIRMYEDFPEIELSVFALTDSKIPDYTLYRRVRSQALSNQGSLGQDEQNELSDVTNQSESFSYENDLDDSNYSRE